MRKRKVLVGSENIEWLRAQNDIEIVLLVILHDAFLEPAPYIAHARMFLDDMVSYFDEKAH